MSSDQRFAAVDDSTANLTTQLLELQKLREQVRKAELALRARRVERRKRTLIGRLAPSPNRSENRRSFSRI
jgi:phage-related minor tail protein